MVLYQVQNPHTSENLLNAILKTHTFNSVGAPACSSASEIYAKVTTFTDPLHNVAMN